MDIIRYNNFICESSESFENILSNSRHDFKSMFNNFDITKYEYVYKYVKNLVEKLDNENIEDNDENTYLNLTASLLAIIFNEEKDTYKHLFEDLRLRGVYKLLEPMVNIVEYIFENINKISENNYTCNDSIFESIINYLKKYIIDNNIDITTNDIENIVDIKDIVKSINIDITPEDIEDIPQDIKKYREFLKDFEIINES